MDRSDHTTEEAAKLGRELPANTPVPGAENREETGRAKRKLEGSSADTSQSFTTSTFYRPKDKKEKWKKKLI